MIPSTKTPGVFGSFQPAERCSVLLPLRDLIFLSLENWDEIWRRNQFVCAELARRAPRRRILFVGKSLFLPQMARHAISSEGKGTVKTALSRRFWRVPGLPNICVFNPLKPFPNPLPGGRLCNENYIAAQIRGAARRARIRDPLLWVNPYDSGFLTDRLGARGVVYDITDDWELAASSPSEREWIQGLDRDLCRRADLTMVCSQALFESRCAVAPHLLLLPNGVDAAHYAQIDADASSPKTPAPAKSPWPGPVFGYTGTLHSERIDLDLVLQLARAHPEGSVVLIGPHHWTGDSLAQALKTQPNLHAPGPVPYARIPEVMGHFDVCIVPHRRSEFVESLNPIKLWEYLACGKPIVATDVAGFRDFPNLVRLAPDARGFILACREALGEAKGEALGRQTPSLCAARRAEAARHSWSSRVETMLAKWCELGLIETADIREVPVAAPDEAGDVAS